jgi:hypothetical protein
MGVGDMVVKYNHTLAGALLGFTGAASVVGIIAAFVSTQTGSDGFSTITIFTILAFMGLGYVFLTRPYFRVDASQIVIFSMIGSGETVHPYSTLSVEGGSIVAEHNGQRKVLPIASWLCDGNGLRALKAQLAQ